MQKVEIRLNGNIGDQQSGWFDGLIIIHPGIDETILSGIVSDQTALFRVISHLRGLGLQITAVNSDDLLDQNPP